MLLLLNCARLRYRVNSKSLSILKSQTGHTWLSGRAGRAVATVHPRLNGNHYDGQEQRHTTNFAPPSGHWESYRYNPLPKSTSTIRLVELLPGATGHIHCKLHRVDLDKHSAQSINSTQRLTYEALSYTWDSQVFSQFVWCNGQVLPITHNLSCALQRLRYPDTSRMLWVDAICINQADISERTQQVGIMKSIYNRATQTIAWLGEDDEYTERAFELVDMINRDALPSDVGLRAEPGAIFDKQAMDDIGLPHFPSDRWEALARLFERPYFQRVWIIQELAASSNEVARCGNLTIHWSQIEYVARLLMTTGWVKALQKLYGPRVKPTFVKTVSSCRLGFYEVQGGFFFNFRLLL